MKVQGYFSDIKRANQTVKLLKEAGYQNSYIDINDHYVEDRNVKTNLPGTENATSLSSLVLNSGGYPEDPGKAPLAAASPMVSGMGRMDEITDVNCIVVAESDEGRHMMAEKIIESMGGDLENPNVNRTKVISHADVSVEKAIETIRENK